MFKIKILLDAHLEGPLSLHWRISLSANKRPSADLTRLSVLDFAAAAASAAAGSRRGRSASAPGLSWHLLLLGILFFFFFLRTQRSLFPITAFGRREIILEVY